MRMPSAFSRRSRLSAGEIADQHALGDLDLEPRRRQPRLQQDLVNRTFEIAGLELDRRQIDGDLQRPRPRCRLAARFAQDPFADLDNQPVLFGKRNELVRRHEATRRMIPAQQSLEADDLAIDPRLRLEVDQELVLLQRLSQIVLQQPAVAQLPVHLGFEEADPPPALALGTIEG
jgi:hypothetical protein